MSFRARALVAMLAAAIGPLAVFAAGVRGEVSDRLHAAHDRRVAALTALIERDLAREAGDVGRRLASLAAVMPDDDRLRLALARGAAADRRYLLDYAGRAMRLGGLDALQLHDSAGRILSSGQFRNDFDRLAPELPASIAAAEDSVVLAQFRTPEGQMLVLARQTGVRIGGASFALMGGVRMDRRLLERFSSGPDLFVTLSLPGDAAEHVEPPLGAARREAHRIEVPLVRAAGVTTAQLRLLQDGGELPAVRRSVDRWFAAAALLVSLGALALGLWLSARLSRPLAELADATGAMSLTGGVRIAGAERDDEIGRLARRLTSMGRRLYTSAEALRDAERRATVGEMARQVNHDIKNGLVPIRNVLRHLAEVQVRTPADLAAVFGERRHTLEASVEYLDALARRYARLAPRPTAATVDPVAIAEEAVGAAHAGGAPVRCVRNGTPPRLHADPLALRRILDNLVRNAVESLTSAEGSVTVRIEPCDESVRISVADTGRGMSDGDLARAFDDFHTTKPNGTGLGLSVVRRLASDIGARLHVDSAPGRGTTISLVFAEGKPVPTALRRERRFPIPDSRLPSP
jgi:signal transduction histidine kinase